MKNQIKSPKYIYWGSAIFLLAFSGALMIIQNYAYLKSQIDLLIIASVMNGVLFIWIYFYLTKFVYYIPKDNEVVQLGNMFFKKEINTKKIEKLTKISLLRICKVKVEGHTYFFYYQTPIFRVF